MHYKTAAIIPVAGLSSRMKQFKPLLKINGFTMICMTIQTALDGGVDKIFLVLGNNDLAVKQDVLSLLKPKHEHQQEHELTFKLGHEPKVSPEHKHGYEHRHEPKLEPNDEQIVFLHNPNYSTTDMFYSLKLGLAAVKNDSQNFDAVFILPADSPAISATTFGALRDAAAGFADHRCNNNTNAHDAHAFIPIHPHDKFSGHPVLLRSTAISTVLDYAQPGGLKAALLTLDCLKLPVDDTGITLDADTPKDFEHLSKYIKATKGVAPSIIDSLLDSCKTLTHIRKHCEASANLALRMAKNLNVHGFCLDTQLVYSAAALHDILRLEKQHWLAAERYLQSLGYTRLAQVVGAHHKPMPDLFDGLDESTIVFLTDKLMQETALVALDERYKDAFEKAPATEAIGKRIRIDKQICEKLLAQYIKITGDNFYQQPSI